MKLNVEDLDFNAHNYEEENFEEFDEIYDAVMKDEVEVSEEDIVKLCKIFCKPFDEVHPHQYIKIQRITFYVIRKVGEETGFDKLIQGLLKIPKQHIDEYLNMLKNSYSEKEICLFQNLLKKYLDETAKYIYEFTNKKSL